MVLQVLRIIAVVSLLGGAAAILTPPGHLHPAFRALKKMLAGRAAAEETVVSPARRTVAFILVLVAVGLCVL